MYIREAKKGDIPDILQLLIQVDMVHHNGRPDLFKGPATKYDAAELEDIIDNDSTPVFVCADENEHILGHAFCIHKQVIGDSVLTDVKTLYIDDICVDEAARGQHAGKMLYDYVVDYAKREGFYNITLNVWNCNPPAMKFYEAMGLKPQKVCMEQILSEQKEEISNAGL
jgi:ribosomal protein S18 acetylase RimI-like enzyme